MTEEDKRSIAKYMNLHTYPKFDWNEEASRFAEGITGIISDSWYEFKTVDLIKLYLVLKYDKIY